jgi:Ca2+-binding RTX toxin-like protein
MTTPTKPGLMPLPDERLAGVAGGAATSGNDIVVGSRDANNWLSGLGGDDILIGYDGSDVLFGGEGNDIISSGSGNDVAVGDEGDDWIDSGRGDDYLFGLDGNDTLKGSIGTDTAFGGEGDDTYVWGTNQSGNDTFYGEGGTNTIEVQVILGNDEGGGTPDQIRNTLEGETFTVDSETKWELVDGKVVFEGPAKGSFTMNGRTIEFTEVSVIKAYQF